MIKIMYPSESLCTAAKQPNWAGFDIRRWDEVTGNEWKSQQENQGATLISTFVFYPDPLAIQHMSRPSPAFPKCLYVQICSVRRFNLIVNMSRSCVTQHCPCQDSCKLGDETFISCILKGRVRNLQMEPISWNLVQNMFSISTIRPWSTTLDSWVALIHLGKCGEFHLHSEDVKIDPKNMLSAMTPASDGSVQSQSYFQALIMGCYSWPTIRAWGERTPPGMWTMNVEVWRAVLAKPAGWCKVLISAALVKPNHWNARAWGCICQGGVYARAMGHMQEAGEVHVELQGICRGSGVQKGSVDTCRGLGVCAKLQSGYLKITYNYPSIIWRCPRWCQVGLKMFANGLK
jgi:hypothetical protein